MKKEIFEKEVGNFRKAAEYCSICKTLKPEFPDPYCKLIQIHTYLYLANPASYSAIKEVGAYIVVLNMLNATRGQGAMFAIRNYYEAIGDIDNANIWNEKIVLENPKNSENDDYKNAKRLYGEYFANIGDGEE